VPARHIGLSHRRCNRAANAWNRLGTGAAGPSASRAERDARESRRQLREGRAAFDAVQEAIAADEAGRDW